MHAVVLVGGFGTRLRPLTNTLPKPMLPIGNVPLLARLIAGLERGGVRDATLALGFQPEPFLAAFPDQRCGSVRLHYAVEPNPLDTAGAIRFAADHTGIDSTFVVANGDILTDLDVAELVATHRRWDAEATLHLIGVADPSAFGVAELDADQRIVRFVEKPSPGEAPSNLINAGTYVFEPSVLELIPPGERRSVERDTFPRLVERGRLFGAGREVYWLDAGRPADYRQANLDLLDGKRLDRVADPVAAGAVVAADARLERSLVGPGASVGHGAVLARSVVLAGAAVGDHAQVIDSIVMGTIGAGARVREVILGAGAAIAPDTVVTNTRIPDPDAPTLFGHESAGEQSTPPRDEPPETPEASAETVAVPVPADEPGPGGGTKVGTGPGPGAPRGPRPTLVIGGAGFLGSHLVDHLLADGGAVEVVDDLSTGSLAALADARSAARAGGRASLHIHTLDATSSDLAGLIALRRPRTVYHLALLGEHQAPATSHGRAFASMLGVMEASRAAGVDKVVVALPATSLYGQPAARELPVKEGPLVARGVRGVVAKAIVDLLTTYRERWDVEFTALALTSVYGPRQRRGCVAAALGAAAEGRGMAFDGDGRQTRDLLFVDDAVDALARAGERGSGLVVNVGTGVQTSLRELWAVIAPGGPAPIQGPPRPDELPRFAVSPVRARIHLGWSPWTSVADGIAATQS